MLKVTRRAQGKVYRGKVYLIDLAGSEDNRRTGNKGIRYVNSNLSATFKGVHIFLCVAGLPLKFCRLNLFFFYVKNIFLLRNKILALDSSADFVIAW